MERVSRAGKERNEQIDLMAKPEGKKLLERPRRRRENRIKMVIKEMG
jgi:hypothetical protein